MLTNRQAQTLQLIEAVQDLITICRGHSVDLMRIRWESMYENEKRCRDEEARKANELIHRMVRAEIRADGAQALFRQIRRWIESEEDCTNRIYGPWGGKSWIIRPHYRPVELPARRDGGAFPQAPPISAGLLTPTDQCANI